MIDMGKRATAKVDQKKKNFPKKSLPIITGRVQGFFFQKPFFARYLDQPNVGIARK
jgi:hypothetical protein